MSSSAPRRRPRGPLLATALLAVVVMTALALLLVSRPHAAVAHTAAPQHSVAPSPPAVSPTAPTTTARPSPTTSSPAVVSDVVGIGDSVTAGTACNCVDFVRRYAERVPTAGSATPVARNLGVSGMTSAQLVDALQRPGAIRSAVAGGDVLLVTIGANDLIPLKAQWASSGCDRRCYSPAVAAVGRNVAAIVRTARALRAGGAQRVLVTDYWNVFEDGDVAAAQDSTAYLRWSDELTRALNSQVCAAARDSGATCVDLYAPFKGDGSRNPTALLAGDGDHPNAAGHDLIATLLLAASATP